MSSEEADPKIVAPVPSAGPAIAAPAQQPGLLSAVIAIFAGAVGFGIPVLGVVASCVGIWFGIRGIRLGRGQNYKPSVTCGIIGISLSVLCIIYWVCVVLFESYR